MNRFVKRLATRLPRAWQDALRRRYLRRQMRGGRLVRRIPEYDLLATLVGPGDWAIDVGANMGLYTLRLGELVGPAGRVVAFEPVPSTFRILTDVVADAGLGNVTLVNAAAADVTGPVSMAVPGDAEYDGYYTAEIAAGPTGLTVLCLRLDFLAGAGPIKFAKIDTEGHELGVLKGMDGLIRRDWPALLVEVNKDEVVHHLAGLGYQARDVPGSANKLFVKG